MRALVFLVLVVLCLCVPHVLARHHHRSKQSHDVLAWLDASAHHDSNSPLLMNYRPEQDDKKDKYQDNDNDNDNDYDDDGFKGPYDARSGLCRQYDCPNFNSTSYPTYTKRSYANVTTACTSIRSYAPWKFGEAEAFKRLYEYFGGENSGNTKINMTVPVVRYVEPGYGSLQDGSHPNVTVCFFLPDDLSANPPTPNNLDVHLIPSSSFDVLIHPFSGFSTHENVGKALRHSQILLHLAGIEFDKTTYIHAAYTEPWILWPRYNEIWLTSGNAKHLFTYPQKHHHHHNMMEEIRIPGGLPRYRIHHGHDGRN